MKALQVSGWGAVGNGGRGLAALEAGVEGEPLILDEWLAPERARRLDRVSQLAQVAADSAIAQAGWQRDDGQGDETAVVVATRWGSQETSRRFAERLVRRGLDGTNPIDFPDSVDGAAAAHLAMGNQWRGPSLTLLERDEEGWSALKTAALLLAGGEARRVCVVWGDASGRDAAAAGDWPLPRTELVVALCLELSSQEAPSRGPVLTIEDAAGALPPPRAPLRALITAFEQGAIEELRGPSLRWTVDAAPGRPQVPEGQT